MARLPALEYIGGGERAGLESQSVGEHPAESLYRRSFANKVQTLDRRIGKLSSKCSHTMQAFGEN